MANTDEIIKATQAKIDQLYRDMKPLMDLYGLKPRTIEERYEEHLRNKAIKNNIPKPRFKLPNL